MIQFSPAAAPNSQAPARTPALLAGGEVPVFSLSLAGLLIPGAAQPDVAAPGRQAIAAGGKKLPEGEAEGDPETGEDAPDAAFAWFAVPLAANSAISPSAAPLPSGAARVLDLETPIAAATSVSETGAGLVEGDAASVPESAPPEIDSTVAAVGRSESPLPHSITKPGISLAPPLPTDGAATPPAMAAASGSPTVPAAFPVTTSPAAATSVPPVVPATAPVMAPPHAAEQPAAAMGMVVPTTVKSLGVRAQDSSPVRIEIALPNPATTAVPSSQAVPLATVAPVNPLVPPTTSQPLAGQIAPFDANLAPQRRAPRDTVDSVASLLGGGETMRAPVVAPAPDTQQGALDLRRQEWMGAMVDRIEALRDSSGARETNIRLTPDALGTVDVSIRHEGDRIHVRINADNPAARAMLAEAQPRLVELAEARGLRLGSATVGTSVDSGAAGQQQGSQRQPDAPRQAFAPASALATSSANTDSEHRIA